MLFLDRAAFFCLLIYAVLSCWGLDFIPSNLIFAAIILCIIRYCLFPDKSIKNVIAPSLQSAFALYLLALGLTGVMQPEAVGTQVWSYADRMLTLPLAVVICQTQRKGLLVALAVAISCLISVAYGLGQAAMSQIALSDIRLSSFTNPITFAGYLTVVISFFLPLSFKNNLKKWQKVLLASTVSLSLLSLILSQTRSGWIAAGSVCLIYLAAMWHKNVKYRAVLLGATLLVAIILVGSSGSLHARLVSIVDPASRLNTERIAIWRSSLHMITDHPVFGVGPDNFGKHYQSTYILPEARERDIVEAHQSFLSFAAEFGLVGLAALLNLFYRLLTFLIGRTRVSAEPEWALGASLALIGVCFFGLMNNIVNDFWTMRLLFLLLGIGIAYDSGELSHAV